MALEIAAALLLYIMIKSDVYSGKLLVESSTHYIITGENRFDMP